MYQQNDEPYLQAINEMQELMKDPNGMKSWFDGKRTMFESFPEDDKLLMLTNP